MYDELRKRVTSAAPVLLADIGGTHSRFALLDSSDRPERVVSWDNNAYGTLENAITAYLATLQQQPRRAVLAVAGPITGREIVLTNRNWHFDLDDLARRFGFSDIRAINDFEAQAWGLGKLREGDYRTIGSNKDRAQPLHGPKLVLGPGTGLGVAALIPVAQDWQPVATEAGHVSFGAANKDEEPVFARLREHGPVSAETVISGLGLPRLHSALHPGTAPLSAEAIVTQALAGDISTGATVRLFVRLLGRFAGDMALAFKAIGGVYIAGGVTGKLGRLLEEDAFRAAFEDHPPYRDLLKALPTYLITVAHPGLIGCAALAMTRRG